MSIANNSRDLLLQVERALARLDAGHLRPLRELRQPDPEGPAAGLPPRDPVRHVQAARGTALTRASRPARLRRPAHARRWTSRPSCSWSPSSRAGARSSCSAGGDPRGVPQQRGGVLLRAGRHRGVHRCRGRRRRRHRADAAAAALHRLGGDAWACCSAAPWATWSTGSPARPGSAGGRSSTSSRVPHFATFNVADSGITVGAALALLLSLRGVELDGRRPAQDDAEARHGRMSGERPTAVRRAARARGSRRAAPGRCALAAVRACPARRP